MLHITSKNSSFPTQAKQVTVWPHKDGYGFWDQFSCTAISLDFFYVSVRLDQLITREISYRHETTLSRTLFGRGHLGLDLSAAPLAAASRSGPRTRGVRARGTLNGSVTGCCTNSRFRVQAAREAPMAARSYHPWLRIVSSSNGGWGGQGRSTTSRALFSTGQTKNVDVDSGRFAAPRGNTCPPLRGTTRFHGEVVGRRGFVIVVRRP